MGNTRNSMYRSEIALICREKMVHYMGTGCKHVSDNRSRGISDDRY